MKQWCWKGESFVLSVRAERELRWALGEASGEMGLRSGFMAMVEVLERGGWASARDRERIAESWHVVPVSGGREAMPASRKELPERAVEAAARERKVRRALEAVGYGVERSALEAVYSQRRFELLPFGRATLALPVSYTYLLFSRNWLDPLKGLMVLRHSALTCGCALRLICMMIRESTNALEVGERRFERALI